jgi:hypothetical protein
MDPETRLRELYVPPTSIARRPDGRLAVAVHQRVLDLDGQLVSDGEVTHVYALRGDLVARMDVEEEPA